MLEREEFLFGYMVYHFVIIEIKTAPCNSLSCTCIMRARPHTYTLTQTHRYTHNNICVHYLTDDIAFHESVFISLHAEEHV